MSERIFTLFGEEVVSEQPKAQAKTRTKKKKDDTTGEQPGEQDDAASVNEAAAQPVAVVENAPASTVTDVATEVPETPAQDPVSSGNDPVSSGLRPAAENAKPAPVAESTEKTPEPEEKNTAITAKAMAEESTATPVAVTELPTEIPVAPADVAATATEEAAPATEEPQAEEEPKKTRKGKEVVTPDEPTGDKQYYSIGEVAELFKVKTSHIRFWTTEFKLKVRTTRKGDRLYSNEAIKELRAIHHLVKERGFTLAGAKTKLKEQKKVEVEAVDLKKSLTQLRNKLVAIKNQLK